MADLRGQQLKDSYQNVVTRGSGNKLENGNGVEFADLDDKAFLSSVAILNVVQQTFSFQTIISSTSYVDSGLNGTITPSSEESKILVIIHQDALSDTENDARRQYYQNIIRDGTQIYEKATNVRSGLSSRTETPLGGLIVFLDEPNTTSQVTYKTQGRVNSTANSTSISFQRGSDSPSSITLMEVQ